MVAEVLALNLADGVATGERGHVLSVEALGAEHADELGEVGRGTGEVAVGRALACRRCIPSAQLHRPSWSAELQDTSFVSA